MRSLSHATGLRHPFLLTLERIEVVDGHLVVVMEMADSNLKVRFQECRRAGLPGIPREEMLGYLREAAEALDYLSDTHSLQHLDVKPENLLLVSGHIKVGDFGLLKELRDTGASLVSGLTPGYALPEVFDGQPSRRSDQYSLAIVYQEMVTGTLPFDGRSSAALASQHLHVAPDLLGLTPHERFAVGKALSKDPAARFASCREFVARLAHRASATVTGLRPTRVAPGHDPCGHDGGPAGDAADSADMHDGRTVAVDPARTVSLPPLSMDWDKLTFRPAVFVGVGGTGGKVLCRLRQLLTDRFGDAAACPALQFLWIDTDVAALDEASAKSAVRGLCEQDTFCAPLRPTWHYRQGPLGNLASLSRRWITTSPVRSTPRACGRSGGWRCWIMPSRSSRGCGRRLMRRSTARQSERRRSRPAWPSRRPIRGYSWWRRSRAAPAAGW